ncbi:DUF3558 domain-containing protein [Streptomyces sp. TRM66268-LWL]|uniref:DUF3558 domain-containing protein n=1 Tax=Streptomyces polyasparticus TaxID=2767826 RepID=A0ABR7STE5_9ACTN|nr:DUF3558 domain-containing protein [Streptomyces polyasparticus]MBC9718683.1 DUF3558 domain-containing protein [Streptomyces polyasparticus]
MRHKRYLAGAPLLAAVLLTGCTSGGDDAAGGDDGKSGAFATSPAKTAEPGRYDTLLEPCTAVDQGTLDSLLPGIEELPDEQREKAYAGTSAITFDTDRRAGCRWSSQSADSAYRLHVDFERAVSYDDAESDDELAARLFLAKQVAADLPEPVTDEGSDEEADEGPQEPSGDGTAEGGSTGASGKPSATRSPGSAEGGDPEQDKPTGSPSSAPPEGLEPRVLDDLADEAFLDDVLGSAESAARQRVVTVVFRTSNVLVTVEYTAQPASVKETPDSKELQDRARVLAGKLAEQFTE